MKKLALAFVAVGLSAQTTPEIPDKALAGYWKAIATFWAAKANFGDAERALADARKELAEMCGKDATLDESGGKPVCKANKTPSK